MVATPECDKMLAVREKSQAIGEFLEWLQSGEADDSKFKRSIFLGAYIINTQVWNGNEYEDLPEDEWEVSETRILPFRYSVEALLAKFFGIDLAKVEKERRALLEEIRCQDATPKGPASTTTGPESK